MKTTRYTDSLYIDLAERPSADSQEIAPGVVPDFDADGNYVTIGFWEGRVAYMVHTESEDLIRIISVRKATKYEEEEFLRQIGY